MEVMRFIRIGLFTAALVCAGAPVALGGEYKVREGDTLEKVHVELGCTVGDLREMNPWFKGIGEEDRLEEGKKIVFVSERDLRDAAESLNEEGTFFERSGPWLMMRVREGVLSPLPWSEVLRRAAEVQKRIAVLPVLKNRELLRLIVVPAKSTAEGPKQ